MTIKYTRELVILKANQIFPNYDISEIMQILDAYGKEKYEYEKERVQLAILKICKDDKGDLELLKKLVEWAKIDYRDPLWNAEYSKQSSIEYTSWVKMREKEQREIEKEDLKQYLKWLK